MRSHFCFRGNHFFGHIPNDKMAAMQKVADRGLNPFVFTKLAAQNHADGSGRERPAPTHGNITIRQTGAGE
jgi:hypothetical protein